MPCAAEYIKARRAHESQAEVNETMQGRRLHYGHTALLFQPKLLPLHKHFIHAHKSIFFLSDVFWQFLLPSQGRIIELVFNCQLKRQKSY